MKYGQRASNFIRRFVGPGEDSNIVCFKFWQLVPAGGCPYRCEFCDYPFLMGNKKFRYKSAQRIFEDLFDFGLFKGVKARAGTALHQRGQILPGMKFGLVGKMHRRQIEVRR